MEYQHPIHFAGRNPEEEADRLSATLGAVQGYAAGVGGVIGDGDELLGVVENVLVAPDGKVHHVGGDLGFHAEVAGRNADGVDLGRAVVEAFAVVAEHGDGGGECGGVGGVLEVGLDVVEVSAVHGQGGHAEQHAHGNGGPGYYGTTVFLSRVCFTHFFRLLRQISKCYGPENTVLPPNGRTRLRTLLPDSSPWNINIQYISRRVKRRRKKLCKKMKRPIGRCAYGDVFMESW